MKSIFFVGISALLIVGCTGGANIGEPCTSDSDCGDGVCWDFHDHDPACSGTICSDTCKTDAECQQMAAEAKGPLPDGARCGSDGLCDFVSVGFGGFACE